MSSEIHCPKCGSNQLTADKKGFSGKKAVAGAILTGGIGILAGTIGSNKIKITCLSCGLEFKPGEGIQTSNNTQSQETEYKESEVKFVGSETSKQYKCENCGKISHIGSKKYCPKCGNKLSDKDLYVEKQSGIGLLTLIIIGLVLIALLYLIFK